MTGTTPKTQVAVKKEKPTPQPKGTTSKTGTSEAIPPPKSKSAETSPVTQTTPENILPREPKGPPPARAQAPAAGIREQSNPRGTAGKTELGITSTMHRGRAMGYGTPSVAPQKAKGAVPQSPRVETPQRSRSAERSGDRPTSRVDTPPRSRSAERSDGRDGGDTPILQPAPIAPATLGWLDAPIETSDNREDVREPPETSEGLGPIVIGGAGRPAPDPPQESESRTSSFSPLSMASRAISALRGIGRSPQPPPPRRGRSSERPTGEGTESGGDGSERWKGG